MYTQKTQQGSAVLWILGIIALGVIAYFIFKSPTTMKRQETTPPAPAVEGVQGQQTVTEGEVVCLPHRVTTGPTTMECAYGIRTDDGKYYGLNTTNLPSNNPPEYQVGDRISVEGQILTGDQIPSNFAQTYNVTGMISVTDFWKFTEK